MTSSLLRFLSAAVLGGSLCFGASAPARAAPSAEEQKLIEQLIADVGHMNNIVFIRNGLEYSSAQAADHLRDKFAYFKNDIQTAEDFIRLCATRSELSGLPYKIRDAAGTVHEAGPFLSQYLVKLKQAKPATAAAAPVEMPVK